MFPLDHISYRNMLPCHSSWKFQTRKWNRFSRKWNSVINLCNSLSRYVAGFQHSLCLQIKTWRLEIGNCFSWWTWHCSSLWNLPIWYMRSGSMIPPKMYSQDYQPVTIKSFNYASTVLQISNGEDCQVCFGFSEFYDIFQQKERES